MATTMFNRNLGMLVLAIWLIVYGLTGVLTFTIHPAVPAVLAIVAGILILVGR